MRFFGSEVHVADLTGFSHPSSPLNEGASMYGTFVQIFKGGMGIAPNSFMEVANIIVLSLLKRQIVDKQMILQSVSMKTQ